MTLLHLSTFIPLSMYTEIISEPAVYEIQVDVSKKKTLYSALSHNAVMHKKFGEIKISGHKFYFSNANIIT